MIVEHNLKFVTEFADSHPVTAQLKSMPHSDLVQLLEGMLKDLIAPALEPVIEELNKNNSYATLKVVK